jgi:2-oxoglutarate/2-oxoacid ferredoxin oxidoreductase subunit beta
VAFDYLPYLRTERLPHIFCPGCSLGSILKSILRALEGQGFTQENTIFVSGIGCTARIAGYVNFDSLHTTHGRAIAFATGIKMVRPELNVILTLGDGDATAIGGNHLIHACRRNIDLTCILFNNMIYGMTGGQYSPMTPYGYKASTAPFGNIERPFDICKLAQGAGASYVARAEEFNLRRTEKLIAGGFKNKGFSLVEVTTHCHTSFGRRNKMPDPAQMVEFNKNRTMPLVKYNQLPEEERQDVLPVGVLHQQPMDEFGQNYRKMCEQIKDK